MLYTDRIYGAVEINEVVLIEVMASRAMQRLHAVLQHGISGLIGLTAPVSRFEHSAGAMLLVRRLGATVEEQVAALLHDVSHTAFSHVMDYVFNGHDDQSYHDRVKEKYVAGTDVPAILAAHGYDWREIVQEAQYTLLEQPAPALCADRLDYFLRDALDLGLATAAEIQQALDHLVNVEERIVTDDGTVAQWLGDTYIAADDKSWANFREVGLYEVTARAIRRGLEIGVLDESDLWSVDQIVWAKLQQASDPVLQKWLGYVSLHTQFVWDEAAPDFWVSTKIRTIDPAVLIDGTCQPVSALDPAFAQRRAAYVQRKTGKWPMRIEEPA